MYKGYQLLFYTRKEQQDEIYSMKLADSMHLALQRDGGRIVPLNHNSGILYAKATTAEDGTLQAKSLQNPWIFRLAKGGYGVIAERIEADRNTDVSALGKLLYFTSQDLIHYTEHPMISLGRSNVIRDAVCCYDEERERYMVRFMEEGGLAFVGMMRRPEDGIIPGTLMEDTAGALESVVSSWRLLLKESVDISADTAVQLRTRINEVLPKGAIMRGVLSLDARTAVNLRDRFLTPIHMSNQVPERVEAGSPEDLRRVRVTARYSDGSCVEKPVEWDVNQVDWNRPGSYRVEGYIRQPHYEFPIAWNRADPCIARWQEKYYFIATNDEDMNHTISIREADSIQGLVTAQESVILDSNTYPHLGNLLWAPEFHVIRDRLYIFHAGTPMHFEEEQCHVMALKENGNPVRALDWEMPMRVVRKDGSALFTDGITLDMTEFEAAEKYYVCWSQRQFVPNDLGAWLYIARIDPEKPWQLITDPVLLSQPEYGWANNHAFVDEGPFAIIHDGKIMLTFSSAAVDSTYVVGMLSADIGADLLNPKNWIKENSPILSSRSVDGEYGPGHNSYVEDGDGLLWNVYHARLGANGPRSCGLRRVHFNREGFPMLDMTEDMDLDPELANVETMVTVKR